MSLGAAVYKQDWLTDLHPRSPGKIQKELPSHSARARAAGGLPFDRLSAQLRQVWR